MHTYLALMDTFLRKHETYTGPEEEADAENGGKSGGRETMKIRTKSILWSNKMILVSNFLYSYRCRMFKARPSKIYQYLLHSDQRSAVAALEHVFALGFSSKTSGVAFRYGIRARRRRYLV